MWTTRVSCTHTANSWRVLQYNKTTQETRLLCDGWTKVTTGHVNVTAVGGDNN